MKVTVDTAEDMIHLEGLDMGVSDWITITQDMLDSFSNVTRDHQWIHTDIERCHKESPMHTTIVHGYFQVSLLPFLLNQIIEVNNLDRLINYGIEKMIFKSMVPVNSRLRLRAKMKSVKDIGDACVSTITCKLEMAEDGEAVMEGSIKYIYYFKSKTNN